MSVHPCLCLHARTSVCKCICLSLCAYTSCLVVVGLCLLLSINGLSQELARQSRLGWASATLISDQIQRRTNWREGELVGWGNWLHTCGLCTPMKLRTIYHFMVTRDLSQGAGNEENGLAGSCGMECLVGGLWLLLYWLPSQITHPTLLILYYFHPCSSVWDISHNSENFFRLSPVKKSISPRSYYCKSNSCSHSCSVLEGRRNKGVWVGTQEAGGMVLIRESSSVKKKKTTGPRLFVSCLLDY